MGAEEPQLLHPHSMSVSHSCDGDSISKFWSWIAMTYTLVYIILQIAQIKVHHAGVGGNLEIIGQIYVDFVKWMLRWRSLHWDHDLKRESWRQQATPTSSFSHTSLNTLDWSQCSSLPFATSTLGIAVFLFVLSSRKHGQIDQYTMLHKLTDFIGNEEID